MVRGGEGTGDKVESREFEATKSEAARSEAARSGDGVRGGEV